MQSENNQGDLVRIDRETGEMVPVQAPQATIESIIARETGNLSNEIMASFDLDSEQGQWTLARHQEFSGSPNDTANMLNVEFDLTNFTMKPVIVKKGADGVQLAEPRIAVRTVLEGADGKLFSSASSWLAQSVRDIFQKTAMPSPDAPVRVVMRKAGLSYKLFRVRPASLTHQPEETVGGGKKKKI